MTINALLERYRTLVEAAPPVAEDGLAYGGFAELVLESRP